MLVGLFTVHDDWTKQRTADKRDPNMHFFTEVPGPAVDGLLGRFPRLLLNGKPVRQASDGIGAGMYQKPAVTDL